MKVAIIHDWLTTYAGAERVMEQFIDMFPEADIFGLVDFLPENERHFLRSKTPKTTFIQHLPFARKYFRHYLPLFYTAMRTLNLSKYDLILSDSHCMAKNVKVHKGQTHVCYCHSPVRYAWDMQEEYLKETGKNKGLQGRLIPLAMRYIRWADKRGTSGVTQFIANSSFIAQRIQNCYQRDAVVVNPPVAVDDFTYQPKKQSYYVTASRMVPYKRIPIIAEAFSHMPDKKLVIIGDGPEMPKVQAAAAGHDNVQVLGYQPFSVLKEHMQNAKAFVFAAKEDFGITPVEAMACGTPVIAFGEGGIQDSVIPSGQAHPTGSFFSAQTAQSVIDAVTAFDSLTPAVTAEDCRKQAERFSPQNFRQKIDAIIQKSLS